jgi:hypothetical protein
MCSSRRRRVAVRSGSHPSFVFDPTVCDECGDLDGCCPRLGDLRRTSRSELRTHHRRWTGRAIPSPFRGGESQEGRRSPGAACASGALAPGYRPARLRRWGAFGAIAQCALWLDRHILPSGTGAGGGARTPCSILPTAPVRAGGPHTMFNPAEWHQCGRGRPHTDGARQWQWRSIAPPDSLAPPGR